MSDALTESGALTARIAALNAAVAHHAAMSLPTKPREILDTAQLFDQYLAGFPPVNATPLLLDEAYRQLMVAERLNKQALAERSQQACALAAQAWLLSLALLDAVPDGTPWHATLRHRAVCGYRANHDSASSLSP